MDNKRKELIEKRALISKRKEKEKAIALRLLPFLSLNNKTGIYMPIQGEVDILAFLQPFDLYAPKCFKNGNMEFFIAENFKKGTFGVMEPDNDLMIKPENLGQIIIPMTGFCSVHRLGYGKGYYDRYLARTDALKIGIAFDEQETEFIPNEWDVDMDLVITPTRILKKEDFNVSTNQCR